MKKLRYLSNATGSGKTEFITGMIQSRPIERFLVVVPNRELCSEICERLESKGVSSTKIINQLTSEKPVRELKSQIELCSVRVLITTQASFVRALLEGIKNKEDWCLVLDEDFAPIVEHEIYFTKATAPILMNCFDICQSEVFEEFMDVHPKKEVLDSIFMRQTHEDSFLKHKSFQNLVSFSYSSSYHTFMDKKHFTNWNLFNSNTKEASSYKMFAVSMLNVEEFFKFEEVIVSSSCFEYTLSYKIFECLGVDLVKVTIEDDSDKRDFEHVTIKYFTEKNWSSLLRKTKTVNDQTMEVAIHKACIADMKGADFIFNANASYRDKITGGKLVTAIQGVNRYMGYKNMLYMPSLNASGDLVRFLHNFGIRRKTIDFDRNVLSAYQFVSRSAVRDKDNKEPITMYVTDKRTAEFLNGQFNNSHMVYMRTMKAKEKIPDNVKSFVSRVKKRLERGEVLRKKTEDKYCDLMTRYYSVQIEYSPVDKRMIKV